MFKLKKFMNFQQKLITILFFLFALLVIFPISLCTQIVLTNLGFKELSLLLSLAFIVQLILNVFSLTIDKKSLLKFLFCVQIFVFPTIIISFFWVHAFIPILLISISSFGMLLLSRSMMWAIAGNYFNTFEAKKYYPFITAVNQYGNILSSIISILALVGVGIHAYLLIWLFIHFLILLIFALILCFSKHSLPVKKTNMKIPNVIKIKKDIIALLKGFFKYQAALPILIMIFLYAFIATTSTTLFAATFKDNQFNLIALYGVLSIIGYSFSLVFLKFINSFSQNKFGKAIAYTLISGIFVLAIAPYFIKDLFVFAVIGYLMATSYVREYTLTTNLFIKIYNRDFASKFQILSKSIVYSLGCSVVFLVFFVPKPYLSYLMLFLLVVFFLSVLFLAKKFNRETLNFLTIAKDKEEKYNAINICDQMNDPKIYKQILEILKTDEDFNNVVGMINNFTSLKTKKPFAEIIDLYLTTKNYQIKIAILKYLDEGINFKQLDPFFKYEMLSMLESDVIGSTLSYIRSFALKIIIQKGTLDHSMNLLHKMLVSNNKRDIANAIEGLNFLNYPGIAKFIESYLYSGSARIKANTVVTIWKYKEYKAKADKVLSEMINSEEKKYILSGIYAAGEVKDKKKLEVLKVYAKSEDKDIRRGALVSLLKLGFFDYYNKIIDDILNADELEAKNMVHLTLTLKPK
ncbi:MAG: hypothetical protein WC860_08010, partial [Candidatus Margulisiibacteriota bacterium]